MRRRAIAAGEANPFRLQDALELNHDPAGFTWAEARGYDRLAAAVTAVSPEEPTITSTEAAARLGISTVALRNRVTRGKVRAIRSGTGSTTLIPLAEVERLKAA